MHRTIVDEKKRVGESHLLHALSYCMLLPGPEAQQLATYIGWLMHRWPGAIMAGGLFVLPGAIAIMALSWVYSAFGQTPNRRGAILRVEGSGLGDRAAGSAPTLAACSAAGILLYLSGVVTP